MTAEELRAADAHSSVIELDRGRLENGTPYWAYVAVRPSRYKEFKRVTAEHRPFRLRDYGIVLKHGFDEAVPLSIKEEMKRDYGCADSFLVALAADVRKAQAAFVREREHLRIGNIVAMLKKQNATSQ